MAKVLDALTEEECYLATILMDISGIDLAEFCWEAPENEDRCFRAWPFQWSWWRCPDPLQVDQSSRSCGKSMGIKVRMFAFPFVFPNQEATITAPELVHLEPIIKRIEQQFEATRLGREIRKKLPTHRPFHYEFSNGSNIIGRIPQRDGKGVKGIHPIVLEQDEACFTSNTLILTKKGTKPISSVKIGDEVYTHQGRWRQVTEVHQFNERPIVNIKGHGCPEITCTPNHHFLIRDISERDWRKRGGKRKLDNPIWLPISKSIDAYWGSPCGFPEELFPVFEVKSSRETFHDITSNEFAWVLGLYLAEGSVCSSYGKEGRLTKTYFSIHKDEVEEVQNKIKKAGFNSSCDFFKNSNGANVYITSQSLARWISEQIPSGARNKYIPTWVFGQSKEYRQAVLDGLIFGDGTKNKDIRYSKGRFRFSTTSHGLAITSRLLGNSLGYYTSIYHYPVPKKPSCIRGKQVNSGDSYEVIFATKGHAIIEDDKMWTKVKKIKSGQNEKVFDLTVEEDNSFLANGIIVHNSDYPEPGWKELIETRLQGTDSVWRSHGVTRGMGTDSFYKRSQHGQDDPPLRYITRPGLTTVHRIVAMARPTWTDKERQEKILEYGSKEDPDYRRNILGAHGDAQSPIFVLSRLMKCVDDDPSSEYNTEDYWHISIKDTELERLGGNIFNLVQPPSFHANYKTVWIGADIGFTIDPTEILIAAEYPLEDEERKESVARKKSIPPKGASRLKLIGRITLNRIAEPDQVEVFVTLADFYKPKVFAMDSTGAGLPLFQAIQRRMENAADSGSKRARLTAESIRGYNFSSKILAEFDETIEVDEKWTLEDRIKETGIKRDVLELSTDVLRTYVDEERFWLPWDADLIQQFRAQTYTINRNNRDQYGRKRIFSNGNFHALDAARMLALGHKQFALETLLRTKEPPSEPVLDVFLQL